MAAELVLEFTRIGFDIPFNPSGEVIQRAQKLVEVRPDLYEVDLPNRRFWILNCDWALFDLTYQWVVNLGEVPV